MRALLVGAAVGMVLVTSAAAAAPTVRTPRRLATRGPVTALAADGDRVAIVVSVPYERLHCAGLVVWEPMRGRVVRLKRPCGADDDISLREGTRGIALAGTRAAWLAVGGGNHEETVVKTASLAHPKPILIGFGVSREDGVGEIAHDPHGDGTLLAFTLDRHCDADAIVNGSDPADQCPPGRETGDVAAATVWRLGGRSRCPAGGPTPVRQCSAVATEDAELSVLAVDAGRIRLCRQRVASGCSPPRATSCRSST